MITTLKSIGSEMAFSRFLRAARKLAFQLYPDRKLVEGERFRENLKGLLSNTSGSVRAAIVGGILSLQSPSVLKRVANSPNSTMALFSMLGRSVIPLLLDDPEFCRQVGYDLEPKAPRQQRETVNLREQPRFFEFGIPSFFRTGVEALVIGSGPGGGAAAASLLRQKPNLKLVLLEAGKYLSNQDIRALSTTRAMMETYEQAGFTTAFDVSRRGISALSVLYGRLVGGTQAISSGTAEIPPEEVVEQIMDRNRFERFYEVLKRDLAISPASPDIIGESNLAFLAAAESLGYNGRTLFGIRGDDCSGIGRCPSGCPTGAKRTSANTYIPEILSHQNTAVAANSKAVKILWGLDGRATGVEVQTPHEKHLIRLKNWGNNGILLLAGGTVGTPDLLFRSGYHPRGLGEGMTVHPVTETFSLDPDHVHNAFHGLPQGIMVEMKHGIAEGAFPDPAITGLIALGLNGKELRDYMALYPHLRIMGGMMADGDRSRGYLRHRFGETFMFYNMHPEDRIRLKLLAIEMLEVWAADERSRYLRLPIWPFFPSRVDKHFARLGFFGREEISEFEAFLLQPEIYLMTFAFHPLGTTRLVIEDKETGKLKGVPNVFVADGSALRMTRKNPQVAIEVSALSKGDRLAGIIK